VVVCVGDRLAGLRRDQGAREVHVVPNGVDGTRFRPTQRHAGPGRSPRPTLIYTGYLGGWAGVDLVLDAARLVSRRLPGLRVILLGHGSALELQALRDGIRAHALENVVEYRGEVSYGELPAHLAEAHVGLAMFRPVDLTRYAFPLKVVEYMAAGLPVLTTADTEAADLVRRAGAGAAVPFDAAATAEAALEILQDAQRCQGYADNAAGFSREYDWDKIMAKYYSLLEAQDASGIGRETAG
jgi:glycosyltransferase involved in cell wall biosynthesis